MNVSLKGFDDLCKAAGIAPTGHRCPVHNTLIMQIRGVVQACIVCDRERDTKEYAERNYARFMEQEGNTEPLPKDKFFSAIRNMFFRRGINWDNDQLEVWYREFGHNPGGRIKITAKKMAEGTDFLSPSNFARIGGFKFVDITPLVDGRLYIKGGPDGKTLGAGV